MRPAHVAASELQIDDGANIVAAVAMLRDAHAPNDDRAARGAKRLREPKHVRLALARAALERFPGQAAGFGFDLLPTGGPRSDELAIRPIVFDQMLEHAVEKRNVAAEMDLEELVGKARAKQRALRDRRHPVTLQPGLEIGVDDEDFRARLLRIVEVFCGHGLVVGDVAADKDEQVAANPIRIGAGGGGAAHCLVQGHGAGRVAETRAGVHVVGAEEARHLLVRVVGLVGQPARGEEPSDAVRVGGAQALGHQANGLIPAHAAETFLALSAHHRHRQPAQLAQLATRQPF